MYKKFVPLTSNQSPSTNPYEICTFMGEAAKPKVTEWNTDQCHYQRDCDALGNSTMDKVLTLQDEIRKIHERTRENIFLKRFKKTCIPIDRFTRCVVPQRTPEQLRLHAQMFQNARKVQYEMKETVHDAGDLYTSHKTLIELEDPVPNLEGQKDDAESEPKDDDAGDGIKPELASPECSRELIYIPPKSLLGIKRPKSGVFINESEQPHFDPTDDIPFSTYNPRLLQEQFDAQNLKEIDLVAYRNAKDIWTWNVGLQKNKSELERSLGEGVVSKFECNDLELGVYSIPGDLDKTFSACITFGTKAIKPQPIPRKKPHFWRPVEMACLYIAFVESFRLNADFWRNETLDNIIKMGEKLIDKCNKMNYKSQDNDCDIIPQIEERQASLNIKLHFAGPLKSEPNIYKALSIFFSKYNSCILCSDKLYLLIWKRCKNFFYVYDPNGRIENGSRDFEKGNSALLSTNFVEHLVHFIVNISQTSMEDEFKLYEIYLTSYGKIPDPLPSKPFPKTYHKQWAVVNDSYAVIPGCNNGLFQPTTAAIDNPSMLISVMAILYSHIERGNTWKPDQVDELIRLGTAYYKSLRRKLKLKDSQHVTIVDLPDKYVLGTFKASMKKAPFMYTATVTDFCKNFQDSLLTSGMKELFANNWEAALLQIDNSVLGIWRDKELFYVYDPFRRGRAGQVIDPDDYRTQGAAILQIHANVESLLRILYEKSLKMRRGGKLFIHAINVGCIKPIMDGKSRKLRYPKLNLTPETYKNTNENQAQGEVSEVSEVSEAVQQKKEKKNKKPKKSKQKDKNKNILPKVCSIATIEEKDRLPVEKNTEVVEPVVDGILCDIVEKFPEPTLNRPKVYKSAAHVLLRSDKEYLENLKYMIKREEDYDNLEMSFRTDLDQNTPFISLEEELKIESNFQALPDGSWIILGADSINHPDEEKLKLTALLSSVVSAALTTKYRISTWTDKLVDYALGSVDKFEGFQTYQYALGTLLHKTIPQIVLGDRTYQVKVQKVLRSNIQKPLRQVLLETLINYNRLMVICQRYCFLIVKRYNFLYMFCGFPVNIVGYRTGNAGPACMMRFVEMDSVIRRIEFGCNPQGCDISNYVVVPLKVWDITPEPKGRYRSWPKNIEKLMYDDALEEKSRMEESKKSKMRFIDSELEKENRRIQDFEDERKKKTEGKTPKPKSSDETMVRGDVTVDGADQEGRTKENEEQQREDECTVEPKHGFSSDMDDDKEGEEKEKDEDKEENEKPRPIVYGYRLREKDLLYKIQGSKALEGRENCTEDKNIKPCLFASALAILYTILKPLNEWTSHRIDQVIDSSLLLSDKIEDMSNLAERILKNVSVDDYIFDVSVKQYSPSSNIERMEKLMEIALAHNKYVILTTDSCSYAITQDTFYNLFDAYSSMTIIENKVEEEEKEQTDTKNADKENEEKENAAKEITEEEKAAKEKRKEEREQERAEKEKAEEQERKKKLKSIKRYGERNTASWILFADIKSMIKYIDQRACKKSWSKKPNYSFAILEIISFKKAPQSTFMLQLLTGMQSCNVHDEQETAVCAHNESIAWLEHCLPIWSRLNRRNAAGRYRGMAVTKLKEYDIEIDHRLWSLWGSLHPKAPVFENLTRSKQYLACCVVALCAASFYRLVDWTPHFLDSIVINGNQYLKQSIETIKCEDYQLTLEDLNVECYLDSMCFNVHIEMVAYGKLYTRPYYNRMNLAEALMYFFSYFQFGILQSSKKCLAIGFIPGHDGGYFMFDCQSRDNPLFPKGQGSSYVLRTKYLQILLYCIVVTLNIPYYNVQFTLHKVDIQPKNEDKNP